jgi:hypothetical protein
MRPLDASVVPSLQVPGRLLTHKAEVLFQTSARDGLPQSIHRELNVFGLNLAPAFDFGLGVLTPGALKGN